MELGDQVHVAWVLWDLAIAAEAEQRHELAARLLGAADALRDELGAPLDPASRADYERDVAPVRAALGEDAFAASSAAGRALPLQQAVAEALALADDLLGAATDTVEM